MVKSYIVGFILIPNSWQKNIGIKNWPTNWCPYPAGRLTITSSSCQLPRLSSIPHNVISGSFAIAIYICVFQTVWWQLQYFEAAMVSGGDEITFISTFSDIDASEQRFKNWHIGDAALRSQATAAIVVAQVAWFIVFSHSGCFG